MRQAGQPSRRRRRAAQASMALLTARRQGIPFGNRSRENAFVIDPFRIYIGWDRREPIAFDVAKFSLERRASIPVAVTPIKIDDLRARGLYRRSVDPLASTEFTYTRFLT